jgi:diphthamide biosynthesis protein 7
MLQFNPLTHSRLLLDTFDHSSGILDIKFNNPKCQEGEIFAVASSTGSISIFKTERTLASLDDDIMGKIVHLNTFQVFPESIVVTSLAWHSSWNGPIAVSNSDGQISILNFHNNYTELHQNAVINSHSKSEAWAVAFAMDSDHLHAGSDEYYTMIANTRPLANEFNRFMSEAKGVYSGGDDSRLRFAMFSRNRAGHTIPGQASTDRHGGGEGLSGHNAGVTAILPLPLITGIGDDILITGSYDDHVRVYVMYDHRPYAADTKPKVLAELNIGGGVWRLTFLEDYTKKDSCGRFVHLKGPTEVTRFRILASCMQGGVRVLEVTGCLKGEWTIKVVADLKFNTSNDLVYAGDVQPARLSPYCRKNEDGEEYVFVSANFYEMQLCLWKYSTSAASTSATPPSPKTVYLQNRVAEFGPD